MNTDGLGGRVKRLEDARESDRTAGPRTTAEFFELRDGRDARPWLEDMQAFDFWPAWPEEADGYHHAWVREHWTPEAAEEYDFASVALSDIHYASSDLLGEGDAAGMATADAVAEAHLTPPPADFDGTVRDYLAAFCPTWVEHFDRDMKGGEHSQKTWPAAELAKSR